MNFIIYELLFFMHLKDPILELRHSSASARRGAEGELALRANECGRASPANTGIQWRRQLRPCKALAENGETRSRRCRMDIEAVADARIGLQLHNL